MTRQAATLLSPTATRARQRLADYGIDIDVTYALDKTSLQHACGLGQYEVVRLLLQAGADVNAVDSRGTRL